MDNTLTLDRRGVQVAAQEHQQRTVLVFKFSGELRFKQVKEFVPELYDQIGQYERVSTLFDIREAEIKFSTMEIYDIVIWSLSLPSFLRTHRRALLSTWPTELLTFLETVSRNRGVNVRLFTNEHDAMMWLTGQTAPLGD